jgi:glycosyltransferase involved in cell wall biosynthesis/O-antigen/teichoic acid export membrane protein
VTTADRGPAPEVVQGARWVTVGLATVGVFNYAYALLLTRLLNVSAYANFAAGQGLILWASNVAVVSVPWVLAQALARATDGAQEHAATRFAKRVSTGSGIVAGIIAGFIATRFADPAAASALGVSTLVVFVGTTTAGWLQGKQRMRSLSVLYVVENLVKNSAGVLLVVVFRLGDAGALAAFGIGGLVMLARWPRSPGQGGQEPPGGTGTTSLWYRAGRIAGAQGLVSLFVAVDVILVALLPGSRTLAANYQASATLSRIPVFVAGAIATAFFPALSRGGNTAQLTAMAMRMYASVALPLAVILMTAPAHLVALVFPAQYGAVATLLKFTAVTGLGAGGISLITAFFQAADDYSCLKWLSAGLAAYALALLGGWRIDGIEGLASGGAIGTALTLALLGYRLVRRQGYGVLARIPLVAVLAAAVVLALLRPYPWPWLAAAVAVGLLSVMRFAKPSGARPARAPRKRVVISSFDNQELSYYNGGGVAVIDMIAAQLATQFDVTILTAGYRGGSARRGGVLFWKLPVAGAGPRFGQLLYHLLLPLAAKRFPHDLWIENLTPPFSTSFVPLFSSQRVIGLAQALTGVEMSIRYRLPFHLIERFGLRFYKDVVVLNEADKKLVRSVNRTAGIEIIPNGIETGDIDENSFGVGDHILFLGRIDVWQKGIDLLLEAYERSGLTLPLVLAGAGVPQEERRLRALLAARRGNVRWVGHVTGQRKRDLLARSAFVAMPSRHEAFGLVALEAMACGKPVLHFNLPTLTWMEGDVAVPSFDLDAMGAKLREMADDEVLRYRLGRRAYEAAKRHSPEEVGNRYLRLVQQILAESAVGS